MTPITRRPAELALCLALAASPASALQLSLPAGARMTAEDVTDPGSYRVPLGRWLEEGGIPSRRAEGRVIRQAWRIDASDMTTLQVLEPLREQLASAGYTVLFDCSSGGCGGFDFRFGTEVMPGPDMYVDLTSFRFLTARGPANDWLTLLISRSAAAAYVQIVRAGKSLAEPVQSDVVAGTPEAVVEGDLATILESDGHVVLDDLAFTSGAATLGEGPIRSLDALAEYLLAHPQRRMVLVGHTDATGSLDANIALSKKRAGAAVDYLRGKGIPAAQIAAEGVGYLAPRASNLSEDGREANRRIEAVLVATE